MAANDLVAAWVRPFLQSITATVTYPEDPQLVCFIMDTGHLIFRRSSLYMVAEPGAPTTRVADDLYRLVRATTA